MIKVGDEIFDEQKVQHTELIGDALMITFQDGEEIQYHVDDLVNLEWKDADFSGTGNDQALRDRFHGTDPHLRLKELMLIIFDMRSGRL